MELKLRDADWLAEVLCVQRPRAYALMREGRVPGVVRLGRQVRIRPDVVQDWLSRGGSALPGGWRRDPEGPTA